MPAKSYIAFDANGVHGETPYTRTQFSWAALLFAYPNEATEKKRGLNLILNEVPYYESVSERYEGFRDVLKEIKRRKLLITRAEGEKRYQQFLAGKLEERIRSLFPPENHQRIREIPEAYSHSEPHRVWLACVELSDGQEDKMRSSVSAAEQDYRDVLYWLERKAGLVK